MGLVLPCWEPRPCEEEKRHRLPSDPLRDFVGPTTRSSTLWLPLLDSCFGKPSDSGQATCWRLYLRVPNARIHLGSERKETALQPKEGATGIGGLRTHSVSLTTDR